LGIITVGQRLDKFVGVGGNGGGNLFARSGRAAKIDFVANRAAEQQSVLKHKADLFAERLERIIAKVFAVDQHGAAGGIVKTRNQAGESSFARARCTHYGNALARLDSQVNVGKHGLARNVFERNIEEFDAAVEARSRPRAFAVHDVAANAQDFDDALGPNNSPV